VSNSPRHIAAFVTDDMKDRKLKLEVSRLRGKLGNFVDEIRVSDPNSQWPIISVFFGEKGTIQAAVIERESGNTWILGGRPAVYIAIETEFESKEKK
jgi:hypothetical protein